MATHAHEVVGSREAHCIACYRVLFDCCRSGELGALSAERQLWKLTQLVSAYACSAREAQLPSTVVLSDLRVALQPLGRPTGAAIELLVQRASADYYAAYPH